MNDTKGKNPWLMLLVLCAGFFMILLDLTIVNIAIPSIISSLKASFDQILWVLNAYTLTYAVLLITAGRLGDLFGQRNMFVLGLVVFTTASALCGLSQDTNQLIAARVAQGVGGAILTPQTLALITSVFPSDRRGAAFGIWGAVAGVATITGPTLGGFIVTNWDWRWIFYVNLPIGVLVMVAAFIFVPDLRAGRRQGLDLVGVVLASAGLFGVTFGLIEGQRYEWGAIVGPITIAEIIAAGLVLLVAFLLWERAQRHPLIPLSIFANRNFTLMNGVGAVVSFGMLGLFLPLTIYLQSVLGFSALKAGLAFAPMSITSMIVAPNAGRLSDRIGGKYILLTGLTLFAVGMGIIDWVASVHSDWTAFLPGLIVAGLGLGCTFAPLQTVAMRNIQPQVAGAAAGIINTTRQLGGVLGSAVVGAVLQNRLATALHQEAVAYSNQVPQGFRQRFIDGFTNAGKSGLEVGRGETGAQLPPNTPHQVALQLQQVFHDVFTNAFVDAMRPTLIVPVGVLLLGAVTCLFIQRRKQALQAQQAGERAAEQRAAAAGG